MIENRSSLRRVLLIGTLGALLGCTDRYVVPTTPEALDVGTPHKVFVSTSRAYDAENGYFGFERSEALSLMEMTVSIPPSHQPGDLNFGYDNPDPEEQFVVANRVNYGTEDAFISGLRAELRKRPAGRREVALFVHGYNSTLPEAAFRATQLGFDLKVPSVSAIYSWPSRGSALGYIYDHDSALFARKGLAETLRAFQSAGAERMVLIAHSMGSALTMDTLQLMEAAEPGWTARNLSGIVLMSPDINVELFRTQVASLNPLPQPFIIFTSSRDKALNLSALISGSQDRLGTIEDVGRVSDFSIDVIDATAFNNMAGSSHLVAATSPALLSLMSNAAAVNATLGYERRPIVDFGQGQNVRHGDAREVVLHNDDER